MREKERKIIYMYMYSLSLTHANTANKLILPKRLAVACYQWLHGVNLPIGRRPVINGAGRVEVARGVPRRRNCATPPNSLSPGANSINLRSAATGPADGWSSLGRTKTRRDEPGTEGGEARDGGVTGCTPLPPPSLGPYITFGVGGGGTLRD